MVIPQGLLPRPMLTRFILSITLFCASIAWAGWVFLHSVGDPHRAERIAHTILDSPDARDEIAVPITDQIVNNAPLDAQSQEQLRAVVSDVLADPRIVDNFAGAFGTAQANALGIGEPRPAVLDVGQVVEVVREHVAEQFPELAAQIPASTQKIELPEVQSTALARVYDLAQRWTLWLALVSLLSLGTLLAVGDRRMVLRSFGFWAIFTGLAYAIGPRLIPLFVRSYAPQADAVVKAMVDSVSPQITTTAIVLVILGVLAFVVRFVFLRNRQVGFVPSAVAPAGMVPGYYVPEPVGAYQPAPQPYGMSGGVAAPQVYSAGVGTAPAGVAYGSVPTYQPPASGPAWAVPSSGPHPRTSIPPEWLPEPTGQVPWSTTPPPAMGEPEPILLRPLDLPTSSENLYPLTHPDE